MCEGFYIINYKDKNACVCPCNIMVIQMLLSKEKRERSLQVVKQKTVMQQLVSFMIIHAIIVVPTIYRHSQRCNASFKECILGISRQLKCCYSIIIGLSKVSPSHHFAGSRESFFSRIQSDPTSDIYLKWKDVILREAKKIRLNDYLTD